MWANIDEIRRAADRAASLTGQLLAFSRKQVMQPRILDLNSVIADMEGMLRRLIGEHIELHTVLAGEGATVRADPGQIEQVIMNLAVNSRDAMATGGRLTIETQSVELGDQYSRQHLSVGPGRYVMLAVSDNGSGMDAATLQRVFEPFFTTKGLGKGTGLGLSTVYGIIKQSGGDIWVYSEPGHGSTFKVYLPNVQEGGDAMDDTSGHVKPPPGTETLLVVEDEPQVRRLVREVLASSGYTVLEASSDVEAMRIAGNPETAIDLLLTDVVMPGTSGSALASRIGITRPAIRVLYMSGYTDNALADHGVLASGIAFLQKPFTPDILLRKVWEVLHPRRRTGETESLDPEQRPHS
jgi:CheY-like chemotaxis protein